MAAFFEVNICVQTAIYSLSLKSWRQEFVFSLIKCLKIHSLGVCEQTI